MTYLNAALFMAILAAPAHATTIVPTFGAAGADSADQTALCANSTTCVVGVETFNTRTTANFTSGFTTDFGTGGKISGTYGVVGTPNLSVVKNDSYGGATTPALASGTSGYYPELFSGSYTLTLSTSGVPGVNYFGLWISALDANNEVTFYSNGQLVYDFTPKLMSSYIAAKSNASSYKGNPDANYADAGEYFAFVNFIATDGTFDKITFTNNGSGTGFESDNATVAYRTPSSAVFGNAIPEPASVLPLLAGVAGLGLLARRRRQGTPA